MTLEGDAGLHGRPSVRMSKLAGNVVPLPPRRAVVSFIGQTMARNSRYQVYLAMYCGTGLALAIACAVTFVQQRNGVDAAPSPAGLHAVIPLLLFWAVAGLRMAFALPLNLPARWIFRLTGASREICISGARVWALACGLAVLAALLPLLWWAHLGGRALLVQAGSGVCLCSLMVDCLIFADRGIPFAQPRSPGRTSLPLMLTLFVGLLPVFCFGMVRLTVWLERKPLYLLFGALLVPGVHKTVTALRQRSQPELADGDEIEGEFQLLGLGTE